jgi:hypothetical protein
MLRTCGYLLGLLMLCWTVSEAGEMQPSRLPVQSGSTATLTQVAQHYKKMKRRKPAKPPKRPKGQHAPRNRHQ